MTIKTKIYLENLKKFLDISDLKEINESHADKIAEFLEKNQNSEVFRDLLKALPQFMPAIVASIKNMEIIFKNIIESGIKDVDSLKEIILSLNKLIEKENLTEKDKDRIFDLLQDYRKTLEETIKGNRDLKKYMIGAGSVLTLTFAYVLYKSIGGKGGEQIISSATDKLLKI